MLEINCLVSALLFDGRTWAGVFVPESIFIELSCFQLGCCTLNLDGKPYDNLPSVLQNYKR